MSFKLTPEIIIQAYTQGLFPMADSADAGHINWVCPELRAQLSIPNLHIPRSLRKAIHKTQYEIKINTCFETVIRECAKPTKTRPETWINQNIIDTYTTLNHYGAAHSIEYWEENKLQGGLYGLSLGGAFFGESMFSNTSNASKIALVHLCARLWAGNFTLLDTQFTNPHLEQFGIYEIPHKKYMKQLEMALSMKADFTLNTQNQTEILENYLQNKT